MPKENILIVEDEADIQELIKFNLEKEGYRVTCVESAELAAKKINGKLPELVILDLMLPGVDGLTFCRQLKADPRTKNVPVIMLTAKSEESDVVSGLEVGADDYVTKPFSPRVLLARVRAVLRRQEILDHASKAVELKCGKLILNTARHEVMISGKQVDLTSTEFKMLQFLMQRQQMVFSRDQIVDSVHGQDYPVTDRSVDVQVVGLRKKLGNCSDYIETVRGFGYRFRGDA